MEEGADHAAKQRETDNANLTGTYLLAANLEEKTGGLPRASIGEYFSRWGRWPCVESNEQGGMGEQGKLSAWRNDGGRRITSLTGCFVDTHGHGR